MKAKKVREFKRERQRVEAPSKHCPHSPTRGHPLSSGFSLSQEQTFYGWMLAGLKRNDFNSLLLYDFYLQNITQDIIHAIKTFTIQRGNQILNTFHQI